MDNSMVKHNLSRAKALLALGLLSVSLAGCVVYPDRGYGPGYYAPAPVVVAPPIVVGGGWGWGWHGGWGRWR
jgi:hypothetical protein